MEPVTHKKDNETYSDDMYTVMESAFSTLYGDVYSDILFENNLVVESTVTRYQDVHYGTEMDSSVVDNSNIGLNFILISSFTQYKRIIYNLSRI